MASPGAANYSDDSEPDVPVAPAPPTVEEEDDEELERRAAACPGAQEKELKTEPTATAAHNLEKERQKETGMSGPSPAGKPRSFRPPVPNTGQAPASPEPVAVWQKVLDEKTGYHYYWNTTTNEVQWLPPPGWAEDPAPKAEPAPSVTPTNAKTTEEASMPRPPSVAGCEADPASAEMKRALMRKVAQLTKVVVHLNARSDEAESRYERLRTGFEDEIRTITQDAMLKVTAYRRTLAELTDPASLQEDANKKVEAWSSACREAHDKLKEIRKEARNRQEQLLETSAGQIQHGTQEVQRLTRDLQSSLAAFREAVGQSRAELDRHSSEVRERCENELHTVAAEHKRRLEELRTAHSREVESLNSSREQALSHLHRMHESELSTLRMQALQKRRESVHRLEQDFGEERRTLEQSIAQMGYELDQQRREIADATGSSVMNQQVDTMRVTLDEMTKRVGLAEAEVIRARDEAAQREGEVAALQSELKVLQLRQRAAGIGQAPAPPNAARAVSNTPVQSAAQAASAAVTGAGVELSQELQEAIAGIKELEAQLGNADVQLANLDDDLTEKEKEVEVLEVEIEEEQLRTHQLQARILEREAALKS